MPELPRTTSAPENAQGCDVAPVQLRELSPSVVVVHGPPLSVRGRERTARAGANLIRLLRSYCPWCGREFTKELNLDLPAVLECVFCSGVWVMTTPPLRMQRVIEVTATTRETTIAETQEEAGIGG